MKEDKKEDNINNNKDELSTMDPIADQNEMAHARTAMSEERTSMAHDRTDLALERTALANSQSLLSYVRTAIAIFAAGVGFFEFINNDTITTIGIVMMGISPAVLVVGFIHYCRAKKNIQKINS